MALLQGLAPDGGLYRRVQALLRGSGLERKYRSWLGRQFNYGALFRKSEIEVAELNGEFYPFWDAAQRKLQPACFFSMGFAHDYTAALQAISAPTLIVQGDADAAGESCGRSYANAIRGSRLVAAPGAGHFPQADAARFPPLVREFLEE